MKARGWALTDVGLKRDHNEDSFLCNNDLALYAVADGMGGHLGGERASRMAVEILEEQVGRALISQPKAPAGPPEPSQNGNSATLKSAVGEASRAIWQQAQNSEEHAGMGTTLTGMLFGGGKANIVHVGDSRAYLYRNGRTRQLTNDHSWIAEQVRAGLLDPNDALVGRFRNIITRSVGFEPNVEPDLISVSVEVGDCFVLCSDGMSNHLAEDEISRVLSTQFYAQAPHTFVDLANGRGGDDNVTVVTVYIANVPAAP